MCEMNFHAEKWTNRERKNILEPKERLSNFPIRYKYPGSKVDIKCTIEQHLRVPQNMLE